MTYPFRVARVAALLGLFLALVVAPAASAYPTMRVGATEGRAKARTLVAATEQFRLAAAAGLEVVRIDELVPPGTRQPSAAVLDELRTTARAAELSGIRLFVNAYPADNRRVPLDEGSRADFAAYLLALARAAPSARSWVIGNEPNLTSSGCPSSTRTERAPPPPRIRPFSLPPTTR